MRCSVFLKLTIQGICLALFIVQIVFAVKKVISKPIMSSVETKGLKSLAQPIIISVCKSSQIDLARAKNIGYSKTHNFFSGNVNFGPNAGKILSWTGAHGNMTFDEMLHFLYQPGHTEVEYGLINGTVSTKFFPFHGFCKLYEINPENYLVITFRNCTEEDSFLVTVYDPATANSFQLARMTNGRIQLECKNGPKIIDYNIQLTETADKSDRGSCVEYPTKVHRTYADCVDNMIDVKTKPVFGYGLPFVSNSTGEPIKRLPGHKNTVDWLERIALLSYGGVKYQSERCLPPCTVLTVYTELQQSASAKEENQSSIYFFFDEVVQVKTIGVAYGPDSLLVEIGSCLGLWLGLSVIGLFDMTITIFERGAKRLKKN